MSQASIGVVITAGGSSTRFGSNKLAARLGDRSVLAWSIAAFVLQPRVAEIVVAIPSLVSADAELTRTIAECQQVLSSAGVRFIEAAGACREETVANAARQLGTEMIAVHDGARPLVSSEVIARVFAAAEAFGAAAPAMPVTSTIKLAGPSLPSRVERTVPRATLWAMQTPQVMRRADLLRAIDACPIPLGEVTDDVQLLELAGVPVMLVTGEERNLKITTPLDLDVARLLIAPTPVPSPGTPGEG